MTAELRPVPAIPRVIGGYDERGGAPAGTQGSRERFRVPALPLRNISRPEKAKRSDRCAISGVGRHL